MKTILTRVLRTFDANAYCKNYNRFFHSTTQLSESSAEALNKIKTASLQPVTSMLPDSTVSKPVKNKKSPSSTENRKKLRSIEGNIRKYRLIGDREEFHHIDRNKNGNIREITDKYMAVIYSTKNNIHINVNNRSASYRTLFYSHCGNVGIRKSARQGNSSAYRVAENIAKKSKRLGIKVVDLKFCNLTKISECIKAFNHNNLIINSITHEPRVPRCSPFASKARKRRRV